MDAFIGLLVIVCGVAAFVLMVRRTNAKGRALAETQGHKKPWEGEKVKPLSAAQRKELKLPAVPKHNPAELIEAATLGLNLELDDEREKTRDFSHLHPEAVSPQTVSFHYESADGELSTREVLVDQVGTSHFAGFCHEAGAERSFRFDRIIGSATLGNGQLITPAKLRNHLRGYGEQELRRQRKAAAKTSQEVLFTGFKAAERTDLEAHAIAAGMTVRKRVTLTLDYLCVGANAGPAKVAEAAQRGAMVLTAEQFHHLIATGELPC